MIEHALSRAGTVGADLLEVPWEQHALGPPGRWPHALANAVRTMLSSRFSMWMAWGPELTFFCNDAYRRDTLGSKYPWALGRSAREVWKEIWPDIGPRIEHVVSTGEATWDEDLLLFLERNGYVEESYHTFSYSPLVDDEGAAAGMLCVVSEETERVIGERRMRTLRDLGTDRSVVREEADVFTSARVHLAANPWCLPFTATYLFDADGDARLVSATGTAAGDPVAPRVLRATATDPVWPLASAAAGRECVVDLRSRFPDIPSGAWPQPPDRAAVLPLGQTATDAVSGFVVVGLNRYRPYDEEYAGFLRLVAGHLGTGVAAARAYQAERARAEALAELDRAKTSFFTNVSHEFRTPLTLLLGPAEDALADTAHPLDATQRERLEVMRRNAVRLLKLVNMLLDFSRLGSGRMAARYEPLDLGGATQELAGMFRPAFEAAGLDLVVEVEGDTEVGAGADVVAHVDHEMWSKIVLNLLSNALKHTFAGGVRVTVSGDDQTVELAVADTGIGVDADEQKRLFERFHRVLGARSRSHEGSGIGLALVAELAELHGGSVGVESTPGQGSTFRVRVRRGTEHLPPEQVVRPAGPPRSGTADRQVEGFLTEALRWSQAPDDPARHRAADPDAPHVLVVDDNADMRDYLVSLLSPTYDLTVAGDGLAALDRVRERRPDIVVSDVMMPGLDGFGLLQKLRGDDATADIPVILLSARAGDEATVEGLDAGADDYLVKPFSARELTARVRSNLELDRSRRNAVELEHNRSLLDQAQRLAAVGSWELDLATGALSACDELVRQTGLSAAELSELGLEGALSQVIHPEDSGLVRAALARAARGEPLDLQVRFVRPDGEVRTNRVLGELVESVTGDRTRLRGSSQDVTEQLRAVELQAAAAAAREAAAREHEIARELQLSLLPERWITPDHLRIATFYRAGVEGAHIGGDWYDVIELGAGRAALVIGDVMGRGVRAAAIMAQLRASARAYARLDLRPADVLELLDGVVRDLGDDQIVTCLYAVYDPGDRTFTFANAGHLPPLLVSGGSHVRRLADTAGQPLGTGPFTLEEETVLLTGPATVALYTDGLVERRDSDIDAGVDALAAVLGRAGVDAVTPDQLVAELLPDGADDDVAILLADFLGESAGTMTHSWPVADAAVAVQGIRHAVADVLRRWSLPPGRADDVLLVVTELTTNAIVHGRPPVELRLRHDGRRVVVEVHDAAAYLPRKQRPTTDDEHGRGLVLVSRVTERWGTRPTDRGKAVWCVLPVG
ncbi:SpoIIE family protein phosphatase [Kineosporia sp. R_H_3]|uniref:SpoIIE family protein phosphatase n=1 Tax=Kineosporia sp. R_H_3 TaxID=1961848 RepID=UPI000B4B48DF|nr:SpoIIE family protein phosphatase [Kineosporia sp. R_H_3]